MGSRRGRVGVREGLEELINQVTGLELDDIVSSTVFYLPVKRLTNQAVLFTSKNYNTHFKEFSYKSYHIIRDYGINVSEGVLRTLNALFLQTSQDFGVESSIYGVLKAIKILTKKK